MLQRDSWAPCAKRLPLQPISARLGVNRLDLGAEAANRNRVFDQLAVGRSGTCTTACLVWHREARSVPHNKRPTSTLKQREK